MDEGILQSRAERYVRNLDPIPDRWFFDGRNITAIYGTRVEEIPFPIESKGFAAEGDEVWRQPTDDRTALEESFDVNTEYMLAVSICPDYLVGESIPKAMKEAMFLVQLIISEQIIEPSGISVQIDTENNEIDLVIATELVFADMSRIHEGITRVVSDNDINAYVYAAFMGSLDRDFYPLKFGYPSGRQAMMGRSFTAEDTLVRNAAIKIGDTDTIVERVAALQKAMNDSEKQERLIRVQYGTKHGLITSMEQALSILAGMGDSFSSEGVDDAIRTQWQSRAGQFIPREDVADEITSLVHEMIADDLLDMFNDREVSGQRMFSPPHCLQLIPDSELPTDADSASWGITSQESIPDDYSALASAWFRSNKYADPNSFITIYIDDQPAFLHSNPDALSIDSWDSYEESLHAMLSDRFDITIYDEDDDEMEACSQCLAKNRYDSSMCWSCTSFIGDETFDAETSKNWDQSEVTDPDELVRLGTIFKVGNGRPDDWKQYVDDFGPFVYVTKDTRPWALWQPGSGEAVVRFNSRGKIRDGLHGVTDIKQLYETDYDAYDVYAAETPRRRGRPVGSGGGTVTCGRCGNTGHNARTCSQTPKQSSVTPTSGAMERKTTRRYICSVCNETGHNKSSCPTLTDTSVPVIKDYRDVDGFEMWPYGGETKMASVGRIKRNVRRILAAHPRGLGRSELKSIYQHNTGSFKKTRPGVNKSTRLASKMPDVIEWRDRFYLLGDGGKQEFFKTGPGSLRS